MSARSAELTFARRPSALGYMLRAFHPTPDLERVTRFPSLRARWRGEPIDAGHRAAFAELTNLPVESAGAAILYPQVAGFRLQMVVLTHPAFPAPIWRVLQIRNHLVQHRPIPRDEALDWETRVSGQRLLDKGAEVDLHTGLRAGGELVWEGLNTFYLRGPMRGADAPSELARPPRVDGPAVASWHMPPGVGWRFAGLTGDFNGIHIWDWYARRFGFPHAFHHPQLAVGQCLARLDAPDGLPRRLDLWLRGPVFYGADVHLHTESDSSGVAFALGVAGDDRPAIAGRWHAGAGLELLSPCS